MMLIKKLQDILFDAQKILKYYTNW